MELIRNIAGTLLTLVNDLLDVAKAESGQLVIDPAEVSLPALLAALRGLTRPMAEGKPVDVVVSAEGAPATVLTDEIALTAILRNLLSNAIKYTDSGEVRLTVRTVGGRIEIRVSDTGTGIPAGSAGARVRGVLPGARGQAGRHRARAALRQAARRAARRRADADQRGGRGTTAVLSLPHGTPSVGTVVVADDDAGFRQVVKSMLAGIADRLIEAEDGAQALAAVAGGGVDLVLADLRMPGVDGNALLERLPAGAARDRHHRPRRGGAAARRGAAAQGGAHQGTAGVRHPPRQPGDAMTEPPAAAPGR